MDQSVCAALAAVFPLITITVVLEGRNVAARMRRGFRFLEQLIVTAVGIGAIGLVVVAIGLQWPLTAPIAVVAWGLFFVDVLVMLLFTLLTAATYLPNPTGAERMQRSRLAGRASRSPGRRRAP